MDKSKGKSEVDVQLYQITEDYHTHTFYSHGRGSVEENVIAAIEKGLSTIAISDHGFRHIGFGMSLKNVGKLRDEIDKMNARYKEIEVLMGIEANLIGLEGQIDIPDQYLSIFDIILMGFHKAVIPFSLKDGWHMFLKNGLHSIIPVGGDKLRHLNTMAMIYAMERYPISIITHPGAKIDIDSELLAYHAAKNNVWLEINASHGFMTAEYVKIAMKQDALFVINSDAHTPNRVGVFDKGVETAKKAGLPPEKIINAKILDKHK